MMNKKVIFLMLLQVLLFQTIFSCRQYIPKEVTNYQYFDKELSDTLVSEPLIAITNEDYLRYGVSVAYISIEGDTIIPFGKYAYFGTDTLKHFAYVMEHPNDSTYGRQVIIDKDENTLFDIVTYDIGPDYFNEGLTRVSRNGKMGFANIYGQLVIPCQFDFAMPFYDGKSEVTYTAREYLDGEDHLRIESEEWFVIDKKGNIIEGEKSQR
ncbi:WG repeat-containing protein [Sediminitomix flava]|uniref:WG repeat protein n=1 Tax=Sediminitomix flava TaxID=379075 RepID=A0A315ZC37_SEDFL|nr:WG repeat-containing protein [Sediminitomix flava]PWJ43101.1 WG repeat protein [Sediminitomix flava]